jgi:hypothetical protein
MQMPIFSVTPSGFIVDWNGYCNIISPLGFGTAAIISIRRVDLKKTGC